MNNIGTIDSDGAADGWLFIYYSAAKDSFVSYQIMSGNPAMVWDFDGGLDSKDELPENWLNSDQVISIADGDGGTQFRANYGDAQVQGLLTLNYPGGNYQISPETPVWRIQYSTSLADTFLIVLVHAVSGAVIPPVSGIDDASVAGEIPETFGLSQNYPNPFNPDTEIRYQLPAACHVSLKIYNLMGQQIKTLVNRKQPAGYYAVRWDGKDSNGQNLTSGVYLYRIQAGSFAAGKKLVLIR
ncbi:MAG TPA: T9SS type A sorting domain-containing protein [bacterium]|nr:T9SS type A sorting domain-containing protein [bacterium]